MNVLARYVRQLQPLAHSELAGWKRRALRIPDPALCQQALATLRAERGNAEGAAMFAVLAPPDSAVPLVRALVAYQVMYDYLDTVTESPVPNHADDCEQLHRAVIDALDPQGSTADWYALHPQRDDGGYVAAQVAACRAACATLPSYRHVATHLRASAHRSSMVQTLSHCAPQPRSRSLRRLGVQLTTLDPSLSWWEHAAGASSTLDVHTLLALAANPSTQASDSVAVLPYLTSLCALNTLLESLVDLPADRRSGDHSYIGHYSDAFHAAARLRFLAAHSAQLAGNLALRASHLAVMKAMVTFYLSQPEAWTSEGRPIARATLAVLGPAVPTMLILHRLRRRVHWLYRSPSARAIPD